MQQINLFDASLRPPKDWLCAANALGFVLLAFFVAGGVYAREVVKVNKAQASLHALERQRDDAASALAQLSLENPPRQADPALRATLSRKERELKLKNRLVSKLATLETDSLGVGFSPFMEGVARGHAKGMWVSTIGIAQGGQGVTLQGGSIDPDLVPIFLGALAGETAFAGKTFRTFHMKRPGEKSKYVEFKIDTRARVEEAGRDAKTP